MYTEFQVITDFSYMEDRYLLLELEKSKDDVIKTKKMLACVDAETIQDDYKRIKIAKLAFDFAHEKYSNLTIEAKKRGLQF